jgi:hypothetical protein
MRRDALMRRWTWVDLWLRTGDKRLRRLCHLDKEIAAIKKDARLDGRQLKTIKVFQPAVATRPIGEVHESTKFKETKSTIKQTIHIARFLFSHPADATNVEGVAKLTRGPARCRAVIVL